MEKWTGSEKEKAAFLENLRRAVYTAFLAAFVQGINVIDLADKENKWSINFAEVIQIWRNGCIIRCDVRSRVFPYGFWLTMGRSTLPICLRKYSKIRETLTEIFSTMNA